MVRNGKRRKKISYGRLHSSKIPRKLKNLSRKDLGDQPFFSVGSLTDIGIGLPSDSFPGSSC